MWVFLFVFHLVLDCVDDFGKRLSGGVVWCVYDGKTCFCEGWNIGVRFGSWKKRKTISWCVDKQLLIVSDSQPTYFDVFVVNESRRSVSQTSQVVTQNAMFHHNCFSLHHCFVLSFSFFKGMLCETLFVKRTLKTTLLFLLQMSWFLVEAHMKKRKTMTKVRLNIWKGPFMNIFPSLLMAHCLIITYPLSILYVCECVVVNLLWSNVCKCEKHE